MRKTSVKGVHRVTKKLSGGQKKEYHYAFRGGPQFWTTDADFAVDDPRYSAALTDALRNVSPGAIEQLSESTSYYLRKFRLSAQYKQLAARTKNDYEKYLSSFEEEFGGDPIAMFQENAVLEEIQEWKSYWAHSAKQYDYAGTVTTRFLNWVVAETKAISSHPHTGMRKLYKSDRSDLIWLPEEVDAARAVAEPWEERILIAFCEGATPQDIGRWARSNIHRTPMGRRIYFRRQKNGNPVSLPVTPNLERVIAETPDGQDFLIVSKTGRELTPHRASQVIRALKLRVNKAADNDTSKVGIRDELRPYDLRGTAATNLLRAGCSLNEIAVTMGWKLRHAANIIERYAALVPDVADEVLAKLIEAQKKAEGKNRV